MKSEELWKQISGAFGLDHKKVVSLDIHLAVNDLVTVDVTMRPDPEEFEEFAESLTAKRYILIEKPEQTG